MKKAQSITIYRWLDDEDRNIIADQELYFLNTNGGFFFREEKEARKRKTKKMFMGKDLKLAKIVLTISEVK